MPSICHGCGKRVNRHDGGRRSHIDAKESIRLCGECDSDPAIVEPLVHQRFGVLIERRRAQQANAKPSLARSAAPKNSTYYDIQGSGERAQASRARGIERSRQVRSDG